GNDMSEGDGQRKESSLPFGPRDGGRSPPVLARRTDPGPACGADGKAVSLVAAKPTGRGSDGCRGLLVGSRDGWFFLLGGSRSGERQQGEAGSRTLAARPLPHRDSTRPSSVERRPNRSGPEKAPRAAGGSPRLRMGISAAAMQARFANT